MMVNDAYYVGVSYLKTEEQAKLKKNNFSVFSLSFLLLILFFLLSFPTRRGVIY